MLAIYNPQAVARASIPIRLPITQCGCDVYDFRGELIDGVQVRCKKI
jgi:hypothetical protein